MILYTHRYRGYSRFEKKGKYRRAKLKWLITCWFKRLYWNVETVL